MWSKNLVLNVVETKTCFNGGVKSENFVCSFEVLFLWHLNVEFEGDFGAVG